MLRRIIALTLVLCLAFSFSVYSAADETDYDVLPFTLTEAVTFNDFGFDSALTSAFDAVVVFNPDSEDILYSKNMDSRFVAAGSVAMLMTTLLALQYCGINDYITPEAGIDELEITHACGMRTGTRYRMIELVAAMLLYNAQDAAAALAAHIAVESGNIGEDAELEQKLAAAVEMMNEEARRLTMKQTVYTNAIGLPESDQRTSAEDITRLMYALYLHSANRYVGDVNYLEGCIARSGLIGSMDEDDPRNENASRYSQELSGYAYYENGDVTSLAFSKSTTWKTAGSSTDGSVFVVGASLKEDIIIDTMNLLTFAEMNFAVLYCNNMVGIMLAETDCPHCTGTLRTHTLNCVYPAIEVDPEEGRLPISVDSTTFTLLTEVYTYNVMDVFTAAINDETVISMEPVPEGEYFSSFTIWFEDIPFITVDLYVTTARTQSGSSEYIVEEQPQQVAPELKSQTIIILAAGIAAITFAVCGVIIVRVRRRKY
ncbi:MAG: hypothetical protein Q4C04_03535 [Clostridia bacterium]|nr:hypothetical protein [Clostridia bacterium]